jgi:serine/threonine-protein kinase HipA
MNKVVKEFEILMFGEQAGVMRVRESGVWTLQYHTDYQKDRSMPPISASLPKVQSTFEHETIFPFFDGILPEGWLAEIGENFGIFFESKMEAAAYYLKDAIGGVSLREKDASDPAKPPKKVIAKPLSQLVAKSPEQFIADYTSGLSEADKAEVNEKLLGFAFNGLSRILAAERCLVCLEQLRGEGDLYHAKCRLDVFGTSDEIIAATSLRNFSRDAFASLSSGAPLPGFQPKAQFFVPNSSGGTELIVKPDVIVDRRHKTPPRGLPIFEHLSLLAARIMGIHTVHSSIIPFEDGSLGYATRRFDRLPGLSVHVEDMAQALNKSLDEAGENKFDGALREVAAVFKAYSGSLALPYTDLMEQFARRVVFSLAIGNHDAHLKNHSIIYICQKNKPYRVSISPAYDLLPLNSLQMTRHKTRESALRINGKIKDITPADVLAEFYSFGAREEAEAAFQKLFSLKNEIIKTYTEHLASFGLEKYESDLKHSLEKRIRFLELNFKV